MTFLYMKGKRNYIHKEGIEAFGKHFKILRNKYGYTQERLSHESGITLSQIARIETGKINPSLSQLIRFSEIMGAPLKELFDFEYKQIQELK